MIQRVFINPGEVYFGDGDLHIETLLGSCVAVTVWHPVLRIGGLCHFMLPVRPGPARPASASPDGRYGHDAIRSLIDHTRRRGTPIGDYVVKIFGGGRVLAMEPARGSVGDQNAHFVLRELEALGLTVTAADLTGDGYRYLRFDLRNGDVWVRRGAGHRAGRRSPARPMSGRGG